MYKQLFIELLLKGLYITNVRNLHRKTEGGLISAPYSVGLHPTLNFPISM